MGDDSWGAIVPLKRDICHLEVQVSKRQGWVEWKIEVFLVVFKKFKAAKRFKWTKYILKRLEPCLHPNWTQLVSWRNTCSIHFSSGIHSYWTHIQARMKLKSGQIDSWPILSRIRLPSETKLVSIPQEIYFDTKGNLSPFIKKPISIRNETCFYSSRDPLRY